MKNKLKGLGLVGGLAGLVMFGGIGLSAKEQFQHSYEKIMLLETLPPYLIVHYNTDKDRFFDLRMIYKRLETLDKGKEVYDLISIENDLNNNNQFDKGEVVYENPKYFPEEKKVEIPEVKKWEI